MSYAGMSIDSGRSIGDLDHIRQSVRCILTTPLGSRVMRRDFGSLLPDLVDAPMNAVTIQRARAATVMAVQRWEPRLRITAVQLVAGESPGQLSIDINAERADGPRRQAVALSVPLRGGAA
ncbi:GPW/gp25 family protein [Jeongeupia chitinilytica]|uniref:Baseplate assembly protein n=1 Tax=Jeongeupia chitinilytica TaxID=1041641 RepID=A0ABQ3GXV5_9NEIS|nr:GPW/gp25 family protein [Jeongeupia chitinilytica]GHD59856.1 baseplate assembly protein [Jeongeupia chitinilytica]